MLLLLVPLAQCGASGCSRNTTVTNTALPCRAECRGDAIRALHGGAAEPPAPTVDNGYLAVDLGRALYDSSDASSLYVSSRMEAELKRLAGSGAMSPPALLLGRGEHAYWLHGVFRLDGEHFYAVRHGVNPVALLSKDEFGSIGTAALRLFCNSDHLTRAVDVGASRIAILPGVCDVGLLAPFQSGKTTAQVINLGRQRIEVLHIEPSCGCATAEFKGGIRAIEANSRADLQVSLKARNIASVKEYITITLRDTVSGEVGSVRVEVIAYQFPALELSTRELQFGPVRQGEAATATFRLTQTKADRFLVQTITAGAGDVRYVIRTSKRQDGLKTYSVDCAWDTAALPPGRHHRVIVVATSSKWRPRVELPAAISVRPDVAAVPTELDFGAGDLAHEEHASAAIHVRSRLDVRGVEALNVRSGMRVVMGAMRNGKIPVDVYWLPTKPGRLKQVLVFLIKAGAESYSVKLPCTGDFRESGASSARPRGGAAG